MALERIPPLVRLQSARSPVDPGRAPARAADERLRLLLSESPSGEVLGRSEDGRSFKLASTVAANLLLVPGQILRVRIVRTSPTLEFVVVGGHEDEADEAGGGPWRPLRPSVFSDAEPAALRTDQAAMQRLIRSAIAAPTLAAAWRTLVLSQLQRAGTVAPAQPEDAPAVMAEQPDADGAGPLAPHRAGPAPAVDMATRPDEAVLVLRVQAWGDWPVTLWLVQRGNPYTGSNRRSARRHGVRLRLTLEVPVWGPIGIEVDVLDTAVALTLTTPRAEALSPLRDGVTTIVQRLVAAGLRLVRCRVQQGEPPDAAQVAAGRSLGALAAAQPPLALFRAATEVLAALSPPSR